MYKIIVVVVAFVAVEAIAPNGGDGYANEGGQDYYTEPQYSFIYEVKDLHTKDIKSHKEERKGEHTQGLYYLIEPDGSKRIVEYVVEGKSGFNAKVHREQNQHNDGSYNLGNVGKFNVGARGSGGELTKSYSILPYALLPSKGLLQGGASYSSLGSYSSFNNGRAGNNLASYAKAGFESNANRFGGEEAKLGRGTYYTGGQGDATSSVKFSTHGAQIESMTRHIIPAKNHY